MEQQGVSELAHDLAITGDRLTKFESLCEGLWPYIRYFGLCGGDPAAVEIVAEIGKLLGKQSTAVDAESLIAKAKFRKAEEIANWMSTSGMIRRMSPDAREDCLESIRAMTD